MPEQMAVRKLGVSKVFARLLMRAVGKFRRGNLLASFQFDVQKPQNGCARQN